MALEALPPPSGFRFADAPGPDDYGACIKCGLCLPSCPTFRLTGEELQSPRGRVQLVAAVDRGVVPLTAPKFAQTLFDCLDCRACEVACPSGVPIGRLIELGRGQVVAAEQAAGQAPALSERAVQAALRHGFPHPRRLERLGRGLRWAQRLRLAERLPAPLGELARALPPLPAQPSRRLLPTGRDEAVRPAALGYAAPYVDPPTRSRVALFLGCVMDVVFAEANAATARVLARNGHPLVVPQEQRCCGALAIHAGERETAKALARQNIDAFLASDAQWVVTNAGGCGAALMEYPEWLREDPAYRDRARQLAERVRDVSQVLVDEGFDPPAAPLTVQITYQESCHLANVMRVRQAPRQLLAAVPGVRLVEMAEPARCCGSAGIYNLTHSDTAEALLAQKMADIPAGTQWVATGNPGCWLQMRHGADRYGPAVEVVHTVEVLDAAYRAEAAGGPTKPPAATIPPAR